MKTHPPSHYIHFSHLYFKMPSGFGFPTYLVQVFVCDVSELSELFVEYDTHYKGNDPLNPGGHYELPKSGKVLILMLITPNGGNKELWTTVRRWTPRKEAYYRSIMGEEVHIEVVEKGDK